MKEVLIFLVLAIVTVVLLFVAAHYGGYELRHDHPWHKFMEWLENW